MVAPDVEAGDQCGDGAADEIEHAADVRRNLDWEMLSTSSDAFWERFACRSADARDWAEQVNQARQIIWPHIEQRPAAEFVIKARIRMPALRPMTRHEPYRSHRLADNTFVDKFAAGLVRAKQEGIGRAADSHAHCFGSSEDALAVLARHGQWLLSIPAFPRGKNLPA